MAITLQPLAQLKRWYGLTTDTKPTTDVQIGSEWIETDTLKKFVWTGSAWLDLGVITATV